MILFNNALNEEKDCMVLSLLNDMNCYRNEKLYNRGSTVFPPLHQPVPTRFELDKIRNEEDNGSPRRRSLPPSPRCTVFGSPGVKASPF